MKNANAKKAKKLWEDLRKSISRKTSPFEGMTKDQVIEKLRETRQKLWEEKIAGRA